MRTLEDMTAAVSASNEDAAIEEVVILGLPACRELMALALAMITAMVDTPGSVSVSVSGQPSVLDLAVSVALGEVGLVIGKEGRNARALRTILGAAAARLRVRVTLDIREAE